MTTRGDSTTARVAVAVASCNGTDYNNRDVSTTAASTDGSDTESITSADTDRLPSPTVPTVDNDVDLINPLPADCSHYIFMMAAGAGLNLPQARLPQPTVFDGTTPPFQEWIQESRNFLSINNYEFIRQMDYALQSDREISLQEVTESTTRGRERRDALTGNEQTQDALQTELETRPAERRVRRDDAAIESEVDAMRTAHDGLQQQYDDVLDRVPVEVTTSTTC